MFVVLFCQIHRRTLFPLLSCLMNIRKFLSSFEQWKTLVEHKWSEDEFKRKETRWTNRRYFGNRRTTHIYLELKRKMFLLIFYSNHHSSHLYSHCFYLVVILFYGFFFFYRETKKKFELKKKENSWFVEDGLESTPIGDAERRRFSSTSKRESSVDFG